MKQPKKFNLISLLTVGTLGFISPNHIKAEEYKPGLYGTINLGAGTFSDVEQAGAGTVEFDAGFSYEGSIGYDFGKHFRTDLSYTKTTSSATLAGADIDAEFGSFMFNGYIDFPIEDSKWEPFVGLGVGTTTADMEETCTPAANTDCEAQLFTYGISGGLNYALNPKADIMTKITYLGFEDIEITNVGNVVTITGGETVSAYIGIKFKF